MTDATPTHGIPYLTGADKLELLDDWSQDLAESMDTLITYVVDNAVDAIIPALYSYQDHEDVAGDVSIDPTIGHHDLDAAGPTDLTLEDATDGVIVSICVVTGADQVTVANVTDPVTFADDVIATFMHRRGAWRAVAGTASLSDLTPPTAPADLVANGGEGEITFSFTPGTDPDSTVSHRYELYPVGGSPTGTTQVVSANPMTVTGLDADDYIVRLFARSAGGNSTAVTDTAVVTAPPMTYEEIVLGLNPDYYYRLDDAPGTTAPANAGDGAGAAVAVTGVTFGAAGIGDGATSADFSGTGYITLPTAANLNGATAFTVGVICDADTSNSTDILANGGGSVDDGWVLGVGYSGVESTWINSGLGTDRCLKVLTFDGTTIKSYKDNVMTSAAHGSAVATSEAAPLLGRVNGNSWGVDGKLAGFFIVSGTAITADQVAELVEAAGL